MTDRLTRLRDRAHNQMLAIKRFADMITEDAEISDISARLEGLNSKYVDFNDLEAQLFEDPAYNPITDAVDNLYYSTRALLSKANNNKRHVETYPDLNTTLGHFIDQNKNLL